MGSKLMTSRDLYDRFQKLKQTVMAETATASESRIKELENEWYVLYDAACSESEHNTADITDELYDEICDFHFDHITTMENW